MLFKSSNGAKLGLLGDEFAFAEESFGSAEDEAPTWLSAGDFVEATDLSEHLAAHLDGTESSTSAQTTNEG